MTNIDTALSLDHGDLINLRALIHNTLAINAIWHEATAILGAHAPNLNAKFVDRFQDNAIAAHWFQQRHPGALRRVGEFSVQLTARSDADLRTQMEASAKAAQFIESMNALSAGLLEGGAA